MADNALIDLSGGTCLARGTYLEGLAVDPVRGLVWYSDVIEGGVHGVSPDGAAIATLDPARMWTGGVLVNRDGKVFSSGQGGIRWNDPGSGAGGWLVSELDGAPVNGINEMCPDGAGGIYFGTIDMAAVIAGAAPGPAALYHLAPGGAPRRVAEGIGFANAIAFDPQRRRLYCNDTFTGTFVYDAAEDFALGARRQLVAKRDADGMALDAAGTLWVTGCFSPTLVRIAPDGTVLPEVPTMAEAITQLRFGGADGQDLFVAAVPGDAGASLRDGLPLAPGRSALWRTRAPVAGMAVAPPAFDLA